MSRRDVNGMSIGYPCAVWDQRCWRLNTILGHLGFNCGIVKGNFPAIGMRNIFRPILPAPADLVL